MCFDIMEREILKFWYFGETFTVVQFQTEQSSIQSSLLRSLKIFTKNYGQIVFLDIDDRLGIGAGNGLGCR